MEKISWNTQRAFEDFEDELYEMEDFLGKNFNNSFDNDNKIIKKEFDILWNKYDELKQALRDEFKVIL